MAQRTYFGAIAGMVLTVVISALGATWYAGTWFGADVARAKEFVDFRAETTKKLDDLDMKITKTHEDVADVRLLLCSANPGKCRLRSAADELEDIHRASSR